MEVPWFELSQWAMIVWIVIRVETLIPQWFWKEHTKMTNQIAYLYQEIERLKEKP